MCHRSVLQHQPADRTERDHLGLTRVLGVPEVGSPAPSRVGGVEATMSSWLSEPFQRLVRTEAALLKGPDMDATRPPVSLKYAVVERERRYLVSGLPEGALQVKDIVDRYVMGTRLRLREVRDADGTVVRKLNHKVRLSDGPEEIACTSVYLDQGEWQLLMRLPALILRKRRHVYRWEDRTIAVDQHEDGTFFAEIDDGDHPSQRLPSWLDVIADVTADEEWTGARLAG